MLISSLKLDILKLQKLNSNKKDNEEKLKSRINILKSKSFSKNNKI